MTGFYGRDYTDDGLLGFDPDDPLATVAEAGRDPDPDTRCAAIIGALRRMVEAGVDTSAEAQVRSYVLRNKLLPAKTFDQVVRKERSTTEESDSQSVNQATLLVDLARKNYRLVRSEDGEAYAVKIDGPNIAIPLGRDGQFGSHLVRLFLEKEGKAPSDQAERMAVKIMMAYLDDDPPEQVHLRIGPHDQGVVLDLGTADGACVVVTAAGWRVEPRSPIIFRRGAGHPLPEPQRDDIKVGLDKLQALVNANESQFRLGVAWLVACLIPGIPHPILIPRGQQGSAKTTLARIFQAIIDPSGVKPGALSRDEQDFAVRMNAAYVQAFDNASNIPAWLSDALCRAATGDSFLARTLYTNRDVTILQYRRPIILTTIDVGQLNGDLVERSLPLDLDRIAPENRRTERAAIGDDAEANPGIYDQLERDRPVMLGMILDLLASVFKHIPDVTRGSLPRMADFGKVMAALDLAQGWQTFKLFSELVDSETGALLEGNHFATRLVEFMTAKDEWHGTTAMLLGELAALLPDKDHPPKGWPPDAPRAGGQLRRLAPTLRVHGLEIDQERQGKGGSREWLVRKILSAPSVLSADHADQREQADSNADSNAATDSNNGSRLTVLTVADSRSPLTVSRISAGQAWDCAPADSADSNSYEKSDGRSDDITDRSPLDPAVTAPCARCGRSTERYGPRGLPLCRSCQRTQPRRSTRTTRRRK